ncbi:hypothetical protein [Ochrobactrum sp. BTU1]|jgi:ribosomal protein L12E/L44/L45/RPP1/RPP2|uniref:hypothetical protein n=1 Tax=Ochrobactrum sp. BTU1 TaxID=2840456 RepID=UPI001C044A84|nr:hypothetical protein KMS41_16930 [Ochrobactrum sp. BTU1]
MQKIWLAKLKHHAATFQLASEKVSSITEQLDFDEHRAKMVLKIVRDGQAGFHAFSEEIREANLTSSYYAAAAEVDQAWTNLVQLLLVRLLEYQTIGAQDDQVPR